jgi:acetolactate synthase-1/3 small subunit
LVDIFRAQIVDVTLDSLIIQIVGKENQVNSLIELLRDFGIIEMVRTGRVAMVRGAASQTGMVEDTAMAVNGNGHHRT